MGNGFGHSTLRLQVIFNPIRRFVTLFQVWDRETKPITVFQIPLLGPKLNIVKYLPMFCLVFTTDIGLYFKLVFSSPHSYS